MVVRKDDAEGTLLWLGAGDEDRGKLGCLNKPADGELDLWRLAKLGCDGFRSCSRSCGRFGMLSS